MEKNTIIAIVLSLFVLIGFQFLIKETTPPPPQQQTPKTEEKAAPAETLKAAPSVAQTTKPETKAPEKVVTVENDLYKISLSSRGASIQQVELKHYKDDKGAPIVLKGSEVLPPLSLGLDEGFQFAGADFSVIGSNAKLDSGNKTANLVFEYSGGGINITRTYRFNQGDYAVGLKDEVRGIDSYSITLGKDFGIFSKTGADHHGPVILKEADRIAVKPGDLKEIRVYKDGVKWIAQEDKYFTAFIVPKTTFEETRAWAKDNDAMVDLRMKGGENSYVIYAGPKEYDILEKYHSGMEHVIDFGFFSIIARPLFWVLKFFYGLLHNYGIAIIILTIVTRIPFFPLISKGQRSMKKLADLQPKMAEIKEKFKNDPQRMQKEMMDLYKTNKVSPMGGCLPMLLQMPVFFALYSILSTAIELRQAPFALWITDLAAPDTLFGHIPSAIPFLGGFALGPLPLLMGATTFIQQKMTPSTADPRQQKIMMIMPIMFTFIFLNFSSGLVLYWLINNILSIAQQFYINKKADKSK
ncbi:MAG TPA: membrane protein insertase YidC [Dissulfurispiraceae bacterium]|nr:membrane protein insertase YidC [Dissulfurispiraceae bacterium]